MPARKRRLPLTAALALLTALCSAVLGLATVSPASAAVQWNDGSARYTTVVNCPSIIFGNPYTENGIGAYAGHAVDLETDQPKVGEIFYIHLEVFGLGNPCAGTVVQPRFNLPAGVSFARNAPIQCYVNGRGGNAPNANCPGWDRLGNDGLYQGPAGGQYPGVFPIPQGVEFEIRVPVVANQALTGAQWSVTLWTADGNSSPTLQLPATMYVFANAPQPQPDPQVSYPNPSTVTAAQTPNGQNTRYGLYSQFNVAGLVGVAGRMGFQFGTSQTNLAEVASVPVAAGNASATAWTDWDEPGVTLQPGRTYFWRGTFDPGAAGGNDVRLGPVQSFTVPGTEPDPDPDPIPRVDAQLEAWASPAKVARTKAATLRATVAPNATGTVTFTAGTKRLCVARISSGAAVCKVAKTLRPGTYKVVATFAGDAAHLPDRDTFTVRKLR